jgi:hypothetical protein
MACRWSCCRCAPSCRPCAQGAGACSTAISLRGTTRSAFASCVRFERRARRRPSSCWRGSRRMPVLGTGRFQNGRRQAGLGHRRPAVPYRSAGMPAASSDHGMGRVVRDLRLTSRSPRLSAHAGSRPREGNAAAALRADDHQSEAGTAPPSGIRRRAARSAIFLVPAILMAGWIWHLGAERRAIMELPQDRRDAVYADTLQAFESMCAPPKDGLIGHCRGQASFLLKFDECDDRCRSLATPLLHWR